MGFISIRSLEGYAVEFASSKKIKSEARKALRTLVKRRGRWAGVRVTRKFEFRKETPRVEETST